jgi:hypothetical protein
VGTRRLNQVALLAKRAIQAVARRGGPTWVHASLITTLPQRSIEAVAWALRGEPTWVPACSISTRSSPQQAIEGGGATRRTHVGTRRFDQLALLAQQVATAAVGAR